VNECDQDEGYPDGCSECGRATCWDSRRNDRNLEMRCRVCGDVVRFKDFYTEG
jgi:translation initiation factor 2 beta subunit (eIF-2beta)/eIF-5